MCSVNQSFDVDFLTKSKGIDLDELAIQGTGLHLRIYRCEGLVACVGVRNAYKIFVKVFLNYFIYDTFTIK